MTKFTLTHLRRLLKPHLLLHGFNAESTIFTKRRGVLQQWISLQRDQWNSSQVRINVGISVNDRFRTPPDDVVCITGCVGPEKVAFNLGDIWWNEEEFTAAVEPLLRYGIPWLELHSDTQYVIQGFERCVQERTSFESLFSPPPSQESDQALTRVFGSDFLRNVEQNRSVPPAVHYYLGLLYEHIGQLNKGCEHTRAYLALMRNAKWAVERTLRQLEDMGCEPAQITTPPRLT